MPSNRRRHGNVLPLASFATWILIAAFVSGGGLYYVYCKNDLHKTGAEIHRLEKEVMELRNQNEVVRSRIDKLSSPKELQKRREKDKNFLAGYVDITRDHLIVVNDKANAGSDLRPVSNPAP